MKRPTIEEEMILAPDEDAKIIEERQKAVRDEAEKRKERIMRRPAPRTRALSDLLATLTSEELADIAYNVGLPGSYGDTGRVMLRRSRTAGVSTDDKSPTESSAPPKGDGLPQIFEKGDDSPQTLEKSDDSPQTGDTVTPEKLASAVIDFSRVWFVSILDEEWQAFRHVASMSGVSTKFREDEMRLDYFESLGLMIGGSYDGKPAWYMPDEILAEFKRLDRSKDFLDMARLNSEAFRIAAGMLFYYGVMDYESLYSGVKRQLGMGRYDARPDASERAGGSDPAASRGETDTSLRQSKEPVINELLFEDFRGVMLNGSCWQKNIIADEHIAYHYTVVDPIRILDAQRKTEAGFARLPYDMLYEAGQEDYIEATDAYKALAQYFMASFGVSVLRAADIVEELTILFQNEGRMSDAIDYIETLGPLEGNDADALSPLLMAFHNSLRLWTLRGHTPGEIVSGDLGSVRSNVLSFAEHRRRRARVGRNDPCPCGSGKKYKNCCMRDDTGED